MHDHRGRGAPRAADRHVAWALHCRLGRATTGAHLGLVPSEYSSGDRRARGRITKRGDARMRWLLVETAWRILRSSTPALAELKEWARQIAARRGKRIATVALAQRVAGILYAMWRDDAPYRAVTTSQEAAA